MTVENFEKPESFWNWIDRYLDKRGVEEGTRPQVRTLLEPVYRALSSEQPSTTVTFPPDVDDELVNGIVSQVQQLEGARHRQMGLLVGILIEWAIQFAEPAESRDSAPPA